MIVILSFVFIVVLAAFASQFRKRSKQPPGPLGLPYFGMKPFLIIKQLFSNLFPKISDKQLFADMRKKYGDFWSMDMGDKRYVVVASRDLIFEALVDNGKLFSGRSLFGMFKVLSENKGLAFVKGEKFQNFRSLAIKGLRDFALSDENLQNVISEELEELFKNIEKDESGIINSPSIFAIPLVNITTQILFNMKEKLHDPELNDFIKNMSSIFHSWEAHNILELYGSWIPLKYLRKCFVKLDQFIQSKDSAIEFVKMRCQARIEAQNELSQSNCVFDYFWRLSYQNDNGITFEEKFDDISQVMFDLYFAGLDAGHVLIGFILAILGKYPDIQEDLRQELNNQVDHYKLINAGMRKDCPKLLSFIDEVHRFHSLGPILVRQTISNCLYKNYEIQNEDVIFFDLLSFYRDPDIFENPDVFNPYRFLDETRSKYIPNKLSLAFGTGKRSCIGEGIAQMEIFLMLSKIILRFDINLPEETKRRIDDIIEGKSGLIHTPLDHKIVLCKRLI